MMPEGFGMICLMMYSVLALKVTCKQDKWGITFIINNSISYLHTEDITNLLHNSV